MQPVNPRLENRETWGTPSCYSAGVNCRCAFSQAKCRPPASYRFYLFDEPGPVRVNEGWGKISGKPSAWIAGQNGPKGRVNDE
jgi:hypothetical protein